MFSSASHIAFPVLAGVGVLGAAGAMARYLLDQAVMRTVGGDFPAGILVANLLGCLALGLLTGMALHGEAISEQWRIPLAAGFLGSFTTFSTFSIDTLRLAQAGQWRLALTNLVVSVVAGLLMAALGLFLGQRLAA